jgi:FkbM family methyltransferase
MASVHSPIRTFIKPLLFKILGKTGYKYAQFYGKLKDIKERLVEEKEMEILPLLVKKGEDVLDIGANYAYYTERLSLLVGDTGKVYAFEPIPFTHDVCKMVVNKLKLTNVELFQLGVSNKNETVEFTIPKLNFGGISAGQAHISGRTIDADKKKEYYNFDEEEKIPCKIVAIDDLLGAKLKNLSFVKIDIEGAEYFALQGMRKTLNNFKPVILIEVQPSFLKGFDIDDNVFKQYIEKDLNYKIFYYQQETQKLHPLEGDFFDNNFILIHAEKVSNFKHLIAHGK